MSSKLAFAKGAHCIVHDRPSAVSLTEEPASPRGMEKKVGDTCVDPRSEQGRLQNTWPGERMVLGG